MTAGQARRLARNRWIAALRKARLSEREIAARVGLSPSRVHRLLEELGADPPRKSERRKIPRSLEPSDN